MDEVIMSADLSVLKRFALIGAFALPTICCAQAGTLKWSFPTGGMRVSSPAISKDGSIVFKASDGHVYAVNRSGQQRWRVQVGTSTGFEDASSPAIADDGTIYVGGGSINGIGHFYALSPNDGSVKWSSPGGYFLFNGGPLVTRHPDDFYTPALHLDGRILISARSGRIYVFGSDGTLHSDLSSSNLSPRTPIIDSQGIAWICSSGVPEGTGSLSLARMRSDGSGSSVLSLGTNRGDPCERITRTIGSDGSIYVRSHRDYESIWAVTPDGAVKWKYPATRPAQYTSPLAAPVVGGDGTLYTHVGGTINGHSGVWLQAISSLGSPTWQFEIVDGTSPHTPAVDDRGTIYTKSRTSMLAVNADGTLRWSLATEDLGTSSSPVIDSDGTIYVGSSKSLLAIRGDSTGLARSSWPMEGADAQHTGRARFVQPLAFANPSNCLFNWAETAYPSLFAPSMSESFSHVPPYFYRYYSATRAYLGSSADGDVYYLGPGSGGSLLNVGALAGWLTTAGCQP